MKFACDPPRAGRFVPPPVEVGRAQFFPRDRGRDHEFRNAEPSERTSTGTFVSAAFWPARGGWNGAWGNIWEWTRRPPSGPHRSHAGAD